MFSNTWCFTITLIAFFAFTASSLIGHSAPFIRYRVNILTADEYVAPAWSFTQFVLPKNCRSSVGLSMVCQPSTMASARDSQVSTPSRPTSSPMYTTFFWHGCALSTLKLNPVMVLTSSSCSTQFR